VIEKTFSSTTQYDRSGWIDGGNIYDTWRAPFPALNVKRRNESVSKDTIFAYTTSIDGGKIYSQFFVGTKTKYSSVYGIKNDSEFIHTLQDVIRDHGAMDKIQSDSAQVEISTQVKEILRQLSIQDGQSEPHYQHQNPAERRYQDVLNGVNRVLNMSGAGPGLWLLCMEYVNFILNRMSLKSLNWRTPFESLKGETPDISMIYRFKFWDEIYFKKGNHDGKCFPSESDECLGRFVGFSEKVGHKMTYKVLSTSTNKVIYRSRIKLASIQRNISLEPEMEVVKARTLSGKVMATYDPRDLIGKTYYKDPDESGEQEKMVIQEMNEDNQSHSIDPITYRSMNPEGSYEEVISYNELIEKLDDENYYAEKEGDIKAIIDHIGPLKTSDDNYNGSLWNVKVLMSDDRIEEIPLQLISTKDPILCARYARKNSMLDTEGWKRFRKQAKSLKKLVQMTNLHQLKSFYATDNYKFGVQVPNNHSHAMKLDQGNGNTLWLKAEKTELGQLDDYEVFEDLGKDSIPPMGFKKITAHFVYDVKHDGRHKARMVAGGHLTGAPMSSVYSSVVSLRGLRTVIFIAELNNMNIWTTDVGNAYLEATTSEKNYIVASSCFGEKEGHTLLIRKDLYGLKTSGRMWWERCSDILLDMGFFQAKVEDDIWMKDQGNHYEYIVRYVDDLAIASYRPQEIISLLESKYKLKLKGSGPIGYHLGCNFFRDETGTLCMSPMKYVERIVEDFGKRIGKISQKKYLSPLVPNDHPDVDESPLLDIEGIKLYQSLIGSFQWDVSIGRIDIVTPTMTMARFSSAPREGHLERLKRILRYLSKMRHATIRFRVDLPDYSALESESFSWKNSLYKGATEVHQ